jgi:hypothetical protein
VSPNKFGIQSSFSHVNTSLQNAIYDTNILSLGAQYALFNLKNWSLEPNAGFYLGLPLKTVMINDTTSTLRYNLVKGYYTGISLIRHYNWGSFQIDSGIRNQLDVIPGNYETSGYYTKVMFMIPF